MLSAINIRVLGLVSCVLLSGLSLFIGCKSRNHSELAGVREDNEDLLQARLAPEKNLLRAGPGLGLLEADDTFTQKLRIAQLVKSDAWEQAILVEKNNKNQYTVNEFDVSIVFDLGNGQTEEVHWWVPGLVTFASPMATRHLIAQMNSEFFHFQKTMSVPAPPPIPSATPTTAGNAPSAAVPPAQPAAAAPKVEPQAPVMVSKTFQYFAPIKWLHTPDTNVIPDKALPTCAPNASDEERLKVGIINAVQACNKAMLSTGIPGFRMLKPGNDINILNIDLFRDVTAKAAAAVKISEANAKAAAAAAADSKDKNKKLEPTKPLFAALGISETHGIGNFPTYVVKNYTGPSRSGLGLSYGALFAVSRNADENGNDGQVGGDGLGIWLGPTISRSELAKKMPEVIVVGTLQDSHFEEFTRLEGALKKSATGKIIKTAAKKTRSVPAFDEKGLVFGEFVPISNDVLVDSIEDYAKRMLRRPEKPKEEQVKVVTAKDVESIEDKVWSQQRIEMAKAEGSWEFVTHKDGFKWYFIVRYKRNKDHNAPVVLTSITLYRDTDGEFIPKTEVDHSLQLMNRWNNPGAGQVDGVDTKWIGGNMWGSAEISFERKNSGNFDCSVNYELTGIWWMSYWTTRVWVNGGKCPMEDYIDEL